MTLLRGPFWRITAFFGLPVKMLWFRVQGPGLKVGGGKGGLGFRV